MAKPISGAVRASADSFAFWKLSENRFMRTSQSGFTLIELVVVIVILGILAAFAVPRFMGLERQARTATANSLAGSIRSASAMAHGVWLANGNNAANIQVDGVARAMALGYPTRGSIDDLLESVQGFAYAPGTGTFTRQGAVNAAQCTVVYTGAVLVGANITPPTVVVQTAGC
jgi:MSHA pilin protein MshA